MRPSRSSSTNRIPRRRRYDEARHLSRPSPAAALRLGGRVHGVVRRARRSARRAEHLGRPERARDDGERTRDHARRRSDDQARSLQRWPRRATELGCRRRCHVAFRRRGGYPAHGRARSERECERYGIVGRRVGRGSSRRARHRSRRDAERGRARRRRQRKRRRGEARVTSDDHGAQSRRIHRRRQRYADRARRRHARKPPRRGDRSARRRLLRWNAARSRGLGRVRRTHATRHAKSRRPGDHRARSQALPPPTEGRDGAARSGRGTRHAAALSARGRGARIAPTAPDRERPGAPAGSKSDARSERADRFPYPYPYPPPDRRHRLEPAR